MARSNPKPACIPTDRVSSPCQMCGKKPDRMHLVDLTDTTVGIYCPGCCPECVPPTKAATA